MHLNLNIKSRPRLKSKNQNKSRGVTNILNHPGEMAEECIQCHVTMKIHCITFPGLSFSRGLQLTLMGGNVSFTRFWLLSVFYYSEILSSILLNYS